MIKIRVSLLAVLLILGCANRGNPTGGEIDMEPPVVLKSSPENFSTNFKAEEIENHLWLVGCGFNIFSPSEVRTFKHGGKLHLSTSLKRF